MSVKQAINDKLQGSVDRQTDELQQCLLSAWAGHYNQSDKN